MTATMAEENTTTDQGHARSFEEHLAETKAMRKARRDEDQSQRRVTWTDEGVSEREQVEGIVFNTDAWTAQDIADKGPNGAKDPAVSEIWLNGPNRFLKVYAKQARAFAATEGIAPEVRVWFAALDRADSVGHAVFESGELGRILGSSDQVVRTVIRKGKALGLLDGVTNSRHVWVAGGEDGTSYGRNLAEARYIRGDGYPAPATPHKVPRAA